MQGLTAEERGDIEQLEGLLSLQLVGLAAALGRGSAPVHSASAEPLDEHAVRGHPQQDPLLQVTEETVHGVGQRWGQRQGGGGGEADVLGAAGPVDALVGDGRSALHDEAALWAGGGHLQHCLPVVQYLHLHPEV